MVRIEESTVVVTGGQRGLGKAIVAELLERGTAKVYATARTPKLSNDLRVVDVTLDVTNRGFRCGIGDYGRRRHDCDKQCRRRRRA